MCSVVKNLLNTFNDNVINLLDRDHLKSNCSVLLLADCTNNPQFAVFLKQLTNGAYALRVHYHDTFIEYIPNGNGIQQILLNGQDTVLLSDIQKMDSLKKDFR